MPLRSLVLAVLCLTGAVSAQTTSTLSALRDNTMYAENAQLSNGAAVLLLIGKNGSGNARRGLVAFDVAGTVPFGAVVQSARVELTLDRTTVGSSVSVSLHRLTADWGEAGSNSGAGGPGTGAGVGAPAQAGDATWAMRFHPAVAWGSPGGDFVGAASATTSVAGSTTRATWSSAQLTADVQAWVDGSQPNHGFLVKGDEAASFTGMGFRTREHPTAVSRPALVVTWAPAAAEVALGQGCSGSSGGGPLQLASNGPPTVPNAGYALTLSGGPVGAPRAYFAFGAALAVPLPSGGGCDVHGDPTTWLATTLNQGPQLVPIPGVPSLYGAGVVFQGLAVDVAASTLVTSGALQLTLGL